MEKKQREDACEIEEEKRKRNKSEHVLDQKGREYEETRLCVRGGD
jgi:hypothetical protein